MATSSLIGGVVDTVRAKWVSSREESTLGRRHLAIGAVVGALVVGGIVRAAVPDSTTGQITACVVKSGPSAGTVRIIDTATASCRSTERAVTWQAQGVRWRGAWSSTKAYRTNDVVSRLGSSYVALAGSTNVSPPNAAKWAVFAAAGSAGAIGASGPPGPAGEIGPAGPSGPQHGRTIRATRALVASADSVGLMSHVTVGLDGLPIVAYLDETNAAMKFLKCADALCSSGSTVDLGTAISNTGIALTLDAKGLPLVVFGDTVGNVVAVSCADLSCTVSARAVILATGQESIYDTSITVGADGLPVVMAVDAASTLYLMKCTVVDCMEATPLTAVVVASTGAVTYGVGLTVGSDGVPIATFAHYDAAGPTVDLMLARCDDATCSAVTTTTLLTDAGYWSSVVIGADGNPVIASYRGSSPGLWISRCGDTTCTAVSSSRVDGSSDHILGYYTSMVMGPDGRPLIAHHDVSGPGLLLSRCNDAQCSTVTTETVEAGGNIGLHPSLAVVPGGSLLVTYYDLDNTDLRVANIVSRGWAPNDWGS